MTVSAATLDLLQQLAGRPGHDEVKAGFRSLMVGEFGAALGDLDFEKRVPEVRGRLDALIGRTVFEAKRNLDLEWSDVERRMPDYLADRQRAEGEAFTGLASDGLKWVVFELAGDKLAVVKRTTLDPETPEAFLAWLDGAVALKSSLPPDALTVRAELGEDSVAWHLVHRQLRTLWGTLKDSPAEALKRQLWADLLKQVYGREVESDALWFQHSYLVVVAKCIALAVMGLPEDEPARLLSGEAFTAAGINGAVESDFFDWMVAAPDGVALVRRIMNHVRRFRLQEVESDVLKILYESLIDRDERHGLGEYYTPDWLAAKVVREAVTAPIEQRVFDPACGSGTFLFHAVRRFLSEAEAGDMAAATRAVEACAYVAGTDIHPVAVIIARVTYLLALAPALAKREGSLSIPVYLGDAMQLSISQFMTGRELVIRVPPPPAGDGRSGERGSHGREQLDFPETFCRDPGLFDKAIERMRTGSLQEMSRDATEAALVRITEQHYKSDITAEQTAAIADLGKTYLVFDRLRREGRDTIWAYVARNLSRPLAFSASGGWANVVVGNPPWVAFRHMSSDLQARFKELAKAEKAFVGGKFATQNDLCALFVARAAHLYLRAGGRLAMVLPMAVLSRGQFDAVRRGRFESVKLHWDAVWTMGESVSPLFPVPSCVVFGRRRNVANPLPETVTAFSGWLPIRDAPEAVADTYLTRTEGTAAVQVGVFKGGSHYRKSFRQGATLVPRMLCLVERRVLGRLGPNPKMPSVFSRRTSLEKKPWNELAGLEAAIEIEFLRPILLGESILPYRSFTMFEGVVPVDDSGAMLSAKGALASDPPSDGLAKGMTSAEATWASNSASEAMSLTDRWNYHRGLENQFPVAELRVVFAASGTQPAAFILRNNRSIVEHKLYWSAPATLEEARYLVAILNSETARARAAGYQSRGQFGARDFDKVIFNLPIPRFDAKRKLHRDLAAAAEAAEAVAAAVALPPTAKFQRARKLVRDALIADGVAARIDALVATLLGQVVTR